MIKADFLQVRVYFHCHFYNGSSISTPNKYEPQTKWVVRCAFLESIKIHSVSTFFVQFHNLSLGVFRAPVIQCHHYIYIYTCSNMCIIIIIIKLKNWMNRNDVIQNVIRCFTRMQINFESFICNMPSG